MKVCFFLDSIYVLGGAQRSTISIANELVKNGYDVSIICTVGVSANKRVKHDLDKKIHIKNIFWHSTLNSILNIWTKIFQVVNNKTQLLINNKKILNYIYYKKNMRKINELQKFVDENDFDTIIGVGGIHTMILSFLKKNRKVKFIGWQHSTTERYFKIKNQFLWHQDIIFKDALNRLDEYVVLTEYDKKELKKLFGKEVIYIYNPIDMKCRSNSIIEKGKIILAVGRYHKVKGYDMLIDAFALFYKKNPTYKLRIVGEGEERENLQNQINLLGLADEIELTGLSNNVVEEYENAEFFVLSSVHEGFGIALVEAMACGLPIVSFDLPCVHEIINKECGYIAKYLDVKDLSECMDKMANNIDKEKMSLTCKRQANRFNIDKIIMEWESIL